jgi:hypothetical protein
MNNPLAKPSEYEEFIYNLPNYYPFIKHFSLVYIPLGTQIGKCVGIVIFADNPVLCVQEFLMSLLQNYRNQFILLIYLYFNKIKKLYSSFTILNEPLNNHEPNQ